MKHKLLLVCIMTLFSASSVMAAEVGYRCDAETDRVVISGKLDNGKERVSIQIYSKAAFDTYAPDAVVNKENIDNILVYSAQGYTGENGTFSFSFPLNESSGTYLARIGAASLTKVIDYGFFYTSPGEEAFIIKQLKSKRTAQELMIYVEGDTPEAIEVFNPDPAYDIIQNRLAIYQKLINNTDYDSLAEFSSLFAGATRLQEINEINDANGLLKKLIEYNSLSGIEEEPFYSETYTYALSDEQKDEVLTAVVDHSDFSSFEEIGQYMGEQTILCAIKNNDWNVTKEVMQTNESFFSEEIREKFSATAAKREKAAKAVAGKTFASLATLEKTIEKAFENKNQSGKGGGGGGGGAGGSAVLPVVTPPPKVEIQKMPFSDLENFEWGRTAVESLWKKAVVSGVSEDLFMPEKEVTRDEFVAMIVRNFGLLNNNAECEFADIPEDDWCYKAVASAYEAGIVFGISKDTFGKGANITRQDMCVIAHRAAKMAGITFEAEAELPFEDDIADYARGQVKELYASGIIKGLGDNLFGAFDNSTRVQAAVLIHGINEYAKEME